MKEEIKDKYKSIKELLDKVELKQYSDPKELDQFNEIVELLKKLKPLIIEIRAFRKMLREEVKSKSGGEVKVDVSGSTEVSGESLEALKERLSRVFEEFDRIPQTLDENVDLDDLEKVSESLEVISKELTSEIK